MAGTQKTHGEGINEYVSFALEQEGDLGFITQFGT